jgi:tRNA nucleotidyltransferase (CCA-adding enzyme)
MTSFSIHPRTKVSTTFPYKPIHTYLDVGVIDRYQKFLIRCEELDVLCAYDLKPLLDGTTLAKGLNARPGPWMKDALDVVVAWQLRNPDIEEADAVLAEVHSWKQQYDQTYGTDQTGKERKHAAKSPVNNTSSPKKQKQGELNSALIYHFLHLTIRPIFSQAQNPDLTSTGRRNINADIARKNQPVDLSPDLPTWMTRESWSLDLLTWVSQNIDSALIEQNWGALIPPILTILDSSDIKMKAQGCTLLANILSKTSPALLKRTGLTPVFEESLYICATYLPSFTSPEDSAFLLNAAIPAILSLANASHPEPSKERTESLLNILRKALLAPYAHASEHVMIAETLYDHLPSILETLGVDCVVHLKDLVPIISNTLDEPLGLSYPPLLFSSINSLLVVLQEAKPRVWFWRGDILRGVCGLWLRLHPIDIQASEVNKDTEELKKQCVDAIDMLDDAITDEEWTDQEMRDVWPDEISTLIEADSRLKSLFVNIYKEV